MSANRRSAHRYDVVLPAQLIVDGEHRPTTIVNLALGGVQIALSERLALGRAVRLSFQLPPQGDTIEVDTTVRWVQDGFVGLQFAGLRPKHVWALNRYLATLSTPTVGAGEGAP